MGRGHYATCSTGASLWRQEVRPALSLRSWDPCLALHLERPVDSLGWRSPVGTRVNEEMLYSVDILVADLGLLFSRALRSWPPGAMS